ncbi:hypothetical protein BOTBODRAFT_146264, partial [Botryobasidium botryosum FD-172 SS1]
GKLKPLKAPKKEKKDEDEEDKAFKAKQKADAAALKDAQARGWLLSRIARRLQVSSPTSVRDPSFQKWSFSRRGHQEVWQEV